MTVLIAWLLTLLAIVDVALTRMRLGREDGAAGRVSVPPSLTRAHTLVGVPAIVLWVLMLLNGSAGVGWIALVFWWATVVVGLLILARWLPAKGRHASDPVSDSWSEGPGLSILAHVGMLLGVMVFTWMMLSDRLPT